VAPKRCLSYCLLSVKYEDIYLHDYQSVAELRLGLERYFRFYNEERPHSALDGRTPWEVHDESCLNWELIH